MECTMQNGSPGWSFRAHLRANFNQPLLLLCVERSLGASPEISGDAKITRYAVMVDQLVAEFAIIIMTLKKAGHAVWLQYYGLNTLCS